MVPCSKGHIELAEEAVQLFNSTVIFAPLEDSEKIDVEHNPESVMPEGSPMPAAFRPLTNWPR